LGEVWERLSIRVGGDVINEPTRGGVHRPLSERCLFRVNLNGTSFKVAYITQNPKEKEINQ
jgi:hypothetical protein